VETVSNAFGSGFTQISDAVWIISEGVVSEDIARGGWWRCRSTPPKRLVRSA